MNRHNWNKTPFKAVALREVSVYLRRIADGTAASLDNGRGLCYNVRRQFRDSSQLHHIILEMDLFFKEKGLHQVLPVENGNQQVYHDTVDKYDAKTQLGWKRLYLARQLSARFIAVAYELDRSKQMGRSALKGLQDGK